MTIGFATAGGLGGGEGPAQVALYDVSGRLVRVIPEEGYEAGYQQVSWDETDSGGRSVSAGIYFLRSRSGGETHAIKLVVVR